MKTSMSLVPSPLVANSPFNTSTTLSSRIDSTYTTQMATLINSLAGETTSMVTHMTQVAAYLIQTELALVEFVAQWVQILRS
jgi:hypothetical protein